MAVFARAAPCLPSAYSSYSYVLAPQPLTAQRVPSKSPALSALRIVTGSLAGPGPLFRASCRWSNYAASFGPLSFGAYHSLLSRELPETEKPRQWPAKCMASSHWRGTKTPPAGSNLVGVLVQW